MRGGVLALDISLSTGWCYGDASRLDQGPVWGVWQLPSLPDLGCRVASFENELADAIWLHQPARIAIEAPLVAGKGSADTLVLLIGLAVAAHSVAYRWERKIEKHASQTARASVCGRCRMTEAEARAGLDVKSAIVAPWVQSMGWTITDHNARDAAVVWAHAMGIRADRPIKGRKA